MAVGTIYDVSPATAPISYDPNSRIDYDVNSAVNSSARPSRHRLVGRISANA